jgi:hypothetical protein
VAWLTAAYVLGDAGIDVNATTRAVVAFVGGLDGATDPSGIVVELHRLVTGTGPRTSWLCPVCQRELYCRERRERRVLRVGGTAFELTNRCWFEHRAHDRRGRPFARRDEVAVAVA